MRQFKFGAIKTKAIVFTGGLNENTNTLQMKPGDLIDCVNYEVSTEEVFGYKSVDGFERWDGSVASIEYPAGSGSYISVGLPSEVPVQYDSNGVLVDDTERESRRVQITPVPGTGPVLWSGVHRGQMFAIRATVADPSESAMYQMTPSGWTQVLDSSNAPVLFNFFDAERVLASEGSLAFYPASSPNEFSLLLVPVGSTSGSATYIVHFSTISSTQSIIDDYTALDPSGSGGLFSSGVIFKNRIYLGYLNGHLFFTKLGLPDFANDTGTAGEVFFSAPVTNLVSAPGDSLVITKERGISILKNITPSSADTNAIVEIDTFSDRGETYVGTAERFMGTVISCTDRGIMTLETTSAFGDFEVADIGSRIASTYNDIKLNILLAIAKRNENKYYVFSKSGDGITLSFDAEKKVVGSTRFNLGTSINNVTFGFIDRVGRECFILSTSDGYVCIQHPDACSFDGNIIQTRLKSAYYHYGSPIVNKQFTKVVIELTAQAGLQALLKASFNYGDPSTDSSETFNIISKGSGGTWGIDTWGNFSWSGKIASLAEIYTLGYGYNMSLIASTESKAHKPHVFHNMNVIYKIRNLEW